MALPPFFLAAFAVARVDQGGPRRDCDEAMGLLVSIYVRVCIAMGSIPDGTTFGIYTVLSTYIVYSVPQLNAHQNCMRHPSLSSSSFARCDAIQNTDWVECGAGEEPDLQTCQRQS